MEEENNKNYNDNFYILKKNPIFNYYSHIINRQNSFNNIEINKISQNYPTKRRLSVQNPNDIQNNLNNENINENKKDKKEKKEKKVKKEKNKNLNNEKNNILNEEKNKILTDEKNKILNDEKNKILTDKNKILTKKNKILTDENKTLIDKKNDNSLEKSDIKTENEKQKNIRIIKEIRSEDLIPTFIKGRTILRINPYIYINESYDFLSNNLYILLKDQSGCKYLQEKLENDTENAVYYFYPALLQNLLFLIRDAFANYFIQKICHYLNEEQIEYMLKILSPEIYDICCDNYGTRAIQGIMDYLQNEKLRLLFFGLIKPIISSLIYEINGMYIIYKLIKDFPEFLAQINDIIIDNCINLATHKKGCTFLENYLIMIKDTIHKQKIIDILIHNIEILIIDSKANYIIQYVIDLGDNNIIKDIINKIKKNISFYSKHKYANYVIDKLIFFSNDENRNIIINILANQEIFNDLVFDQQGSYIILKALKFADRETKNIMINRIKNLEPKIKTSPFGTIFLNQIYNNNLYINNNILNKKSNKNENQ